MGREHQAASNSHAMPGTLTGGTRRHRAHPLRAVTRVGRASVRRYRWGRDPGSSRMRGLLARLIPALIVILASAGIAVTRMTPPATVTVPADVVTTR